MTAPLPRHLPRLSAALMPPRTPLPERVLQFGEGNFLRAFVDWMLERMNRAGVFNGAAVVIQPLPRGATGIINDQDGLYTVALRGGLGGRPVDSRELVSAVSRCIDPYADPAAFLRCATNPDTRFVVSNTTEAGITLDRADAPHARPAPSFPGKLTQLLHERFRHFRGDPARGWVMLPCELVERNGDALRRAVTDTARAWGLPAAFHDWLDASCVFTNTLVDRIVTGYPTEDAEAIQQSLGYEDRLLVAAEPFHSWVIEAPAGLDAELPLQRAGLDVIWTNDVTPYRERKVRILNGTHTMAALVGHLAGLDTVAQCMEDEQIRMFLESALADEIVPTLGLPAAELQAFSRSVLERFRNPFLQHRLVDITLNSASKFRARLLGPLDDGRLTTGRLPPRLTFSLAALIAFARGAELRDGVLVGTRAGTAYPIRDDQAILASYRRAWSVRGRGPLDPAAARHVALAILGDATLWGRDLVRSLPGVDEVVAGHLASICTQGVRTALGRL